MFNIGDKVRSISNGIVGHVTFIEDDYVEIDPGNGVSIDFDVSNLTLWTEPEPVESPQRDLQGFLNAPYVPQSGDRKVASTVMKIVDKLYPILLDGLRESVENFDTLPPFDQVKAMSEQTETPMVVFMGAVDMGDDMMLSILQRAMLNSVIIGNELISNMIIGRVKRVIAEHEE